MSLNLIGGSHLSHDSIGIAIDKYIYVVLNPTPLVNHISARYSITENVTKLSDLKNERIKNVLLKYGIKNNIEIGSFANYPIEIGFRSHHSYTGALICAANSLLNKKITNDELSQLIIEIESKSNKFLHKDSRICAAVWGGINKYSLDIKKEILIDPIYLNYTERMDFEKLISVYYISKTNKEKKIKTTKIPFDKLDYEQNKLVVNQFVRALMEGRFDECAYALDRSWKMNRQSGVNIPSALVDKVYDRALKNGALGGTYIGDQFSGCLLLMGSTKVIKKIDSYLEAEKDIRFSKFGFSIVQSGIRTVFKLN